jgi:redox-sensitive bicupin YhaK (pirin superfamily)
VWSCFHGQDPETELSHGFGELERLDEALLRPGGSITCHAEHAAEVITYVREGSLAYADLQGHTQLMHAGEFQCRSLSRGAPHAGKSASSLGSTLVLQIWLRLAEDELAPHQEQRHFSAAQRRGLLCVVASPDGRNGSLRIHPLALLHSALLERGQHVAHELSPGRCAWLHLVEGEATLGDFVLETGDGAGVTADRAVSLTARKKTEILLMDLREPISHAADSAAIEEASSGRSGRGPALSGALRADQAIALELAVQRRGADL